MRLVGKNDGSGRMIWILPAIFVSMSNVGQSTFTKIASTKGKTSGSMYINTLKVGAALVLFLLISFYKLQFHLPTLLFASIYGLALFFSTFFGYMALMSGPMALTSLIVSYSVIIPCIFGVILLDEAMSPIRVLGMVLLLISMYLLKQRSENVKSHKKWFMYVAITFLCNGIYSVIQKLHQTVYPSSYCNEFTIYSLFVTFILFFIITIYKKEGKCTGVTKYAVLAGILMGLGNYISLLLSSRVNATVLFPTITIFSMLCNVTVSKLYFKDKFSVMQLVGIGVGVFSVLLIK